MSGPTGPTGITGAYGLQGFRGLRGLPYGPTGPPYRGAGTRLTIQSPTGTSITLTESSLYTYYNIASQATTTIVFPTRSESYPTPEQTGAFWVFRNNTGTYMNISVTYTGTGGGGTASIVIPPANSTTVMFVANTSGSNAYVFF